MFFSLIPLGHQRGFPGTNLALGATPGEEIMVSQGKVPLLGGCLPSLAQLLMNIGYPSLEQGQGRVCAHLTPLPAHKPRADPAGDTTGPLSPPSHPWLGLIPVLFPFSVSPKASLGSRLCSFVQPNSC